MTNFRPGDKVRVTYDVVVNKDGYFCGQYVSRHRPNISGHVVELIQPADDPSKDPVGTVRKSPDGAVATKTDGADWVQYGKALGYRWLEDRDVTGWEKLAPVEGTPAAKVGHAFESSFSGMVCGRMVIRDGYGDSCGLPADVHGES